MEYTDFFVTRVNEVYHDVEGDRYEQRHPEILVDEIKRWKLLGEQFIKNNPRPLTLLDIGTGTGFVPLQIVEYLRKGDTLTCSDVSQVMLDAVREKLSGLLMRLGVTESYIKLDNGRIPMSDGSVDMLTVNSVLHHIQDLDNFFSEVNRVMGKDGIVIITHEPNALFYANTKLWLNYRICSFFFNPKQFIIDFLMRKGIFEWVRGWYYRFSREVRDYNEVISEVNYRLKKDGLIERDLTASEMTEIVDIHSPGAGGKYASRGFSVYHLQSNLLKDYKILWEETYDHILTTSTSNFLTCKYDQWLNKRFPKDGSHFSVVFKKIC
ncbi:MAG: class I SAM-dependent methyltransferase [Patescibacteria group bacterium]|nr:class I SAM-dependent methyltransferase [Patescibacteria group bacterium]